MPDCLIPANPGVPSIPVDAVASDRLPAVLDSLGAPAAAWLRATGFAAVAGDIALIPDGEGSLASVLLGLGDATDSPSMDPARLPGKLPEGVYRLRDGFPDPAFAALAWALGAYRFTRYRAEPGRLRRLTMPAGIDGGAVARIADGVYLARDLVNTGANDLGPAELAAAAADLARRHGAMFSEIVG